MARWFISCSQFRCSVVRFINAIMILHGESKNDFDKRIIHKSFDVVPLLALHLDDTICDGQQLIEYWNISFEHKKATQKKVIVVFSERFWSSIITMNASEFFICGPDAFRAIYHVSRLAFLREIKKKPISKRCSFNLSLHSKEFLIRWCRNSSINVPHRTNFEFIAK